MKTYNFTFHTDPSHGWIEVPMTTILALGLAGKISPYSYKDRAKAYLEEDCDAGLLYEAIKASGDEIKLDYKHTDGDCFVRNLPRF